MSNSNQTFEPTQDSKQEQCVFFEENGLRCNENKAQNSYLCDKHNNKAVETFRQELIDLNNQNNLFFKAAFGRLGIAFIPPLYPKTVDLQEWKEHSHQQTKLDFDFEKDKEEHETLVKKVKELKKELETIGIIYGLHPQEEHQSKN